MESSMISLAVGACLSAVVFGGECANPTAGVSGVFDVLDYGARGDGRTINTTAITKAIEACARAGGGMVTVPAGVFKTGTVWLRSNVELHLRSGAMLLASDDLKDYNPLDAYPQNFSVPAEKWKGHHLIIAHSVTNVAITGQGVINGNGDAFFGDTHSTSGEWAEWRDGMRSVKDDKIQRPGQLIAMIESRDIRLADFRIRNSPCWSVFLHGCENVQIRGLDIRNGHTDLNTDGIDIDCSRFVTVSDCLIDTGDDGITLRGSEARLASGSRPCEFVTIANCVLAVRADAMRIGVGDGIIRNVVINNLVIHHAGIGFQFQSSYNRKSSGVDISAVTISNVRAVNCARAVVITPGVKETTAGIRDVRFHHCDFDSFQPNEVLRNANIAPRGILFDSCSFTSVAPNSEDPNRVWPGHFDALLRIDCDGAELRNCRVSWRLNETRFNRAFNGSGSNNLVVRDCVFPDCPNPLGTIKQ